MLIQQKGNICILAFTKSNNNNCYNLTSRARTASPIKHTGLVPLGWGNKKCDQHMSGTGNTELKGLEREKNLGSIFDITRTSSLIYLTKHEGQ